MDTIYALASARGKAGVCVFRISGPRAFEAARHLTGRDVPERRPVLRQISDREGRHIDTGLALGFPSGQSFTGEEVVELQLHGSPAVVASVLSALGSIDGLRHADPGEFTRRALENGRLDLTQVEGLADLIEAETESQRRQALTLAEGGLRRLADEWRTALVRCAALIAASVDFADEDLPTDLVEQVGPILEGLAVGFRREIVGSRNAERVREGFQVAIVGRPNTGKSTLLNALAGRDAAITSDVAGTTRDVIEVHMDLQGLPVTLLDTAGMRETEDQVEQIGVDRARNRAEQADLRVFLVADGDTPVMPPEAGDLVVTAKGDLSDRPGLRVSGLTGLGLDTLISAVVDRISERAAVSATATRERQRRSISEALGCIEAAQAEILQGEPRVEFASDELHRAIRALDMLVGRVDVEQVLDEIFASFCLGK